MAKQKILDNCDKSLKELQVDKVDIYYLHGPDKDMPLAEQCAAINELYKEGNSNDGAFRTSAI